MVLHLHHLSIFDLCEGETQLVQSSSALLKKLVEARTKVAREVYYHLFMILHSFVFANVE